MELKKAEEMPGCTGLIPKDAILLDMMLTHARLAKLYADTDQANLSLQHVNEALACARSADKWSSVTNQTSLQALVDRIDHGAHD
jgi:hypothetical protein